MIAKMKAADRKMLSAAYAEMTADLDASKAGGESGHVYMYDPEQDCLMSMPSGHVTRYLLDPKGGPPKGIYEAKGFKVYNLSVDKDRADLLRDFQARQAKVYEEAGEVPSWKAAKAAAVAK